MSEPVACDIEYSYTVQSATLKINECAHNHMCCSCFNSMVAIAVEQKFPHYTSLNKIAVVHGHRYLAGQSGVGLPLVS